MAGPTGNETNHTLDGLTVRGGLSLEGTGGVSTYLNRDAASDVARRMALMRGLGYYAETYPQVCHSGASLLNSGGCHFVAIGLLAGDVVTSITVQLEATGTSITLAKNGLYSVAGTLLASSASGHASFGTLGKKTLAMTTPYTITTDGMYYVCHIQVAASSAQVMKAAGGLGSSQGVGSGGLVQGFQGGQADLPASATISLSASSLGMWMAVA